MLKPFQISDLYASSSQAQGVPTSPGRLPEPHQSYDPPSDVDGQSRSHPVGESHPRPHGIVRLSATAYDDLASNYPRARLTYIDDDDGELITVGSSIELSERLDEPVNPPSQLAMARESTSPALVESSEMHLFDIRRSNSVTELWKKFEDPAYSQSAQAAEGHATNLEFAHAPPRHEEEVAESNNGEAVPTEDGGSQSLLAAFETEMAKLVNASEGPGAEPSQQNTSASAGVQPEPTRSGRVQNPADAFAQAINNIVDGAEMVRNEVRSRIPDFERQLQNAQRALPGQVGTTLQMALATLESHVRNLASALNNISVPPSQRTGPNSQTQPSAASHTVDGLRTMASEIGQLGQTLFAAFENEFGRLPSVGPNQILNQGITAPSTTNNQERNGAAGVTAADTEDPLPDHRRHMPFDNEKETLTSTNAEANKPITQSDNMSRERNPAFPRHYNSCFAGPQQHYMVPPTSFAADRGNTAMASHTSQPLRNLPFRHPSHHQQNIRAPSFPPLFFPSIPPPPQHYAAPPPFWYTEQPPVHLQQPRAGVSLGNHSGASAGSTNRSPRDEDETQAHRSANKILFVGNVGFDVSESMIQTVFASKGFLVDANLPLDSQTGKHAGFGYLQFASTHAAKAALEALQGTHIDGHSINLEFSDCSPITGLYASRGSQGPSSQSRSKPATGPISQGPRDLLLNIDNALAQPKKPCLKEQNGKRKGHSSSDNRKSLAFKDPIPSLNTKTGPDASNPRDSNKSPEMDALLDQDSGDSDFATRYPSLLPDLSTKRSRRGDSDYADLLHVSPEMEMRRFPPVSQLDAHALANRRQETQPTAGASTTGPKSNDQKRTERENVPGSFPLSDSLADLERFQTSLNSIDNLSRGLRRSNTMMPVNPSARLSGPFDPLAPETASPVRPLRRSATQREPLRDAGYFNRDVRRGRHPYPVSSLLTGHSQPRSHTNLRSFPSEDLQQNQEANANAASKSRNPEQSRVDNDESSVSACVTTLLNLGYGGMRDGGLSRITMYAEVARGNVLEAIEMIEEERKAYEQSPSMR